MLKINNTDIYVNSGIVIATGKHSTCERVYSNLKYVKPFFPKTEFTFPYFKKNGVPLNFCRRGGRPTFSECNWSSPMWMGENGFFWTKTASGEDARIYLDENSIIIFELIGAGGGGTGGGALLSGVGGGAGGYAVVAIDFLLLGANKVLSFVSDAAGIQAPNRGTASAGGDTKLLIDDVEIINCHGGGGADAGTPGQGGAVTFGNLPAGVTVLYSATGQNGTEGVEAETSTCPSHTVWIGYETEGDNFKLTRGGYSITSAGSGAGVGGSSQFGAGGRDGTTNNGYDGRAPYVDAYGAGGGGGHGRAFSSSNGGNGGYGTVRGYC